jgi:hypothetical protein
MHGKGHAIFAIIAGSITTALNLACILFMVIAAAANA